MPAEDFHEFLTGNRFLLKQVFRFLMQQLCVVFKNLPGFRVRVLDDRHDFLVDQGCRFIRADQRCVAAQIPVVHRFQRRHAELIAHAQLSHHCPRQPCRLFDIVGRAGGTDIEHKFFRRPAAGQRADLFQNFVLAH